MCMQKKQKTTLFFLLSVLLALFFQCIPFFISFMNNMFIALMVHYFFLYLLLPLSSLLVPFYLVYKKQVNAYLAFFPIGLCLLIFPSYMHHTAMGFVCLILSLFSVSFAKEYSKKRRGKQ